MKLLVCLSGLLLSFNCLAVPALNLSEVAPGVYMHQSNEHWPDRHNHGDIANIGFIVGTQCVAVIDSGGSPQQGMALRHAIQQTTSTPICYVINTHVHPDHIYGNLAFKTAGVKFVGHHKLARAMASRAPHYLSRADEVLNIKVNQDHIIPPDIEVKDSLNLDLGNRIIRLTAHPAAHTDNDLSVFDQTTQTLWLADLLFLEHIPVIDGSLKGWLTELDKLAKQPYRLVIPGHGKPVSHWPLGMQAEKQYLSQLAQDIRSYIKNGKTLEQAVSNIGINNPNQWQLAEQFHRKNITIAFAELEWED